MTNPIESTSNVSPPPYWWRAHQALKGTNPARLTEGDVPRVELSGKWIIVTGANNGIGYEASKVFAEWGANLILACREPPPREQHPTAVTEECQSLAKSAGYSSEIEWWKVDFADLSSVESFAKRWLDTGRALDVLCNNAGTGAHPTAKRVYTVDGYEFIHQVNFLSHVLLTLRLLPSLARSPSARIVCTTSCNHFFGRFDLEHFNNEKGMGGDPYGNNKLYFQMWIAELQARFLKKPEYRHIIINGVHPGYVNSGIWNTALVDTWLERLARFLADQFAITSQQGGLALVNAATNKKIGEEQLGGKYINRIWEAVSMPYCHDDASRLRLWRKLDEDLGLTEKGLLKPLE